MSLQTKSPYRPTSLPPMLSLNNINKVNKEIEQARKAAYNDDDEEEVFAFKMTEEDLKAVKIKREKEKEEKEILRKADLLLKLADEKEKERLRLEDIALKRASKLNMSSIPSSIKKTNTTNDNINSTTLAHNHNNHNHNNMKTYTDDDDIYYKAHNVTPTDLEPPMIAGVKNSNKRLDRLEKMNAAAVRDVLFGRVEVIAALNDLPKTKSNAIVTDSIMAARTKTNPDPKYQKQPLSKSEESLYKSPYAKNVMEFEDGKSAEEVLAQKRKDKLAKIAGTRIEGPKLSQVPQHKSPKTKTY